ncbi:MAG: acyl--CoA ligase [Oscillospiraceae bacterium]|nr:acyl--CoA ligase [Oscillospiraceae bacterium]
MREFIVWENDVVTLGGLLKYASGRYGNKPAIKYAVKKEILSVSYNELFRQASAVKNYLNSVYGDKCNVGIIGRTDHRYISSMNGIFMSGKTLVPLSPDYDSEKLVYLINDADIKVLFYDASQKERINELKPRISEVEFFVDMSDIDLYNRIFSDFDENGEYKELCSPDACAVIMYTSGTTGKYKGVMLSHRALISNVWFKEMSFEGENVTLNVLPMHHIFCMSCDYLKNIKDGVTICLNVELKNIYRNLLLFEPTVLRLVPMIIESLINKVDIMQSRHPQLSKRQAGEAVFGKRLKNIIASGATLSPGLAARFDEMGVTIRQGYGMTETGPRISVPDGNTRALSGGRIISICEVRLQNGEIQVKSPSLLMGYYKNPEETAKVFTPDGWFKTGDIGEITEDNELFIKGRIKNLIILSNGENVSPEEIEKAYADEPLIKELMVFAEENKIAASFYPDLEFAAENGISDIETEIRNIVDKINLSFESTREISKIYIRKTPFERTTSGKIIRKQEKTA